MAGVPTVHHSVAPNSAPGSIHNRIFIYSALQMSFFFCACIAIHSKRTFAFKENFFKAVRNESDCDLSSEEDNLNKK